MLSRKVAISGFRASVRVSACVREGEGIVDNEPSLEMRGTIAEPVRGLRDVVIEIYPKDEIQIGTTRPVWLGRLQLQGKLDFVTPLLSADFDRVWALATSGHLKYAEVSFTKPHYNQGRLLSVSFSNEREEPDTA
jgi:hypothetical protein